jgi:hypothetical protein
VGVGMSSACMCVGSQKLFKLEQKKGRSHYTEGRANLEDNLLIRHVRRTWVGFRPIC